ncbi:hypothetical protein V8E51_000653 [Hyaloscypha variabilis]
MCDAFWRWPVAVRRQRLLPLLAGKVVGWRWDGGSSVVSCSQTPPLQPRRPLTTSRTAQASEDVQPANRQARTPTISSAHAAHWAGGGGKNSIYAPMAILPSHSSILLAWTAPETSVDLPAQPRVGLRSLSRPSPTTASVRRLEQTLRDLLNPHGEANGVDEWASHCSRTPFACHWDHQRWERAGSNQGRSIAHRPYPRSAVNGKGKSGT